MYRRVTAIASRMSCVIALIATWAIPNFGQTTQPLNRRATLAEAQQLLNKNPELKAGFNSPGNTTIEVIKPIDGGFAVRFHDRSGTNGQFTIVGPPTIIADKSIYQQAIDLGKSFLKTLGGGSDGGAGGGGTTSCGNFTIGDNSFVVINGSICSPK